MIEGDRCLGRVEATGSVLIAELEHDEGSCAIERTCGGGDIRVKRGHWKPPEVRTLRSPPA